MREYFNRSAHTLSKLILVELSRTTHNKSVPLLYMTDFPITENNYSVCPQSFLLQDKQ